MNTRRRVLLGAGVFAANTVRGVPSLQHSAWGEALLIFSALVLAPLWLELIEDESDDATSAWLLLTAKRWQFPAALLLVASFLLAPGITAASCAVPWAVVLLLLATTGLRRVIKRGWRPLSLLGREVGLMYAAVAAAWLLADRLAFQPLGFDRAIVLLTAVHFHYAGLLVPVLTSLALDAAKLRPGFNLISLGVIAGVPAVAMGITASQLRLNRDFETAAALLMAVSGLGVAGLHLWLAGQARWSASVRLLWAAAGSSLAMGMSLAVLYAVRYFFHPWPWLDIPWMRALHGSLNALGFGCCGVLAWWRARAKIS